MAETYPEPASISARSSLGGGENMTKASRGPSTVETLHQKLAPMVDRVHRVNVMLGNLGDRSYGETPTRTDRDASVREAPPYGGAMAQLFYTIDSLEEAIEAA